MTRYAASSPPPAARPLLAHSRWLGAAEKDVLAEIAVLDERRVLGADRAAQLIVGRHAGDHHRSIIRAGLKAARVPAAPV
eukprot:CAMPEP_0185490258 /NCGR_PEP_ID=MMETSP1366-20130426/13822_1 /TAXON_ID=38817 /ORGANISM="Gephyrocapsa oceanica, Strain RCC1303" /LENGTH=79 /DNA_ID=CAMNT_0028098921 /DNA_START=411 /DNA_END=651 /DNA_ORIENTATION=+